MGHGSESLNSKEAAEKLADYHKAFAGTGGDDALQKHGRSLACSACQMAANRFQTRVARKIKGKLSDAEKEEIFRANLEGICSPSNWPKQMAVVEKKGNEIYVDWMDAMSNREGKVSVKRMSPEVSADVMAVCTQVLQQDFREPLLRKVLDTKKGRVSDTNFVSWLCGPDRANVCDRTAEDDEDSDREDGQEEL